MSSTEAGIHPRLNSLIFDENIFPKSTYDATANEQLTDRLDELGVETVYLAGFETDACVLATALGLFDLGIQPIIIESCCSSETDAIHTAAVSILERNIGTQNVVSHTEIQQQL